MNKDYLIKLTFSVYQSSEWWPEENLLKFKVRDLANEILSDFILLSMKNPSDIILSPKILKEIQEIQTGFIHARAQRLLDRNNFLLFQKEYNNTRKILERLEFPKRTEPTKKEISTPKKTLPKAELNERQKKTLEILKEREKVQVQDLQKVFPGVTKRTLRRDLDGLLKKGLIERGGAWNEVFYALAKTGQTGNGGRTQ